MVHQRAFRVAVDGKLPVNKSLARTFAYSRRLAFAAAAFFVTSTALVHAQAGGPFAGMAGTWSGGGTVTLDDGSRERLRCRATYVVPGATMSMGLTCASDAYKFDLRASVVAEGGNVAGTWSETSRNVGGNIQGRGAGGSFHVIAQAAGFSSDISLRTTGNKQHIAMKADSQFRAANITLSK